MDDKIKELNTTIKEDIIPYYTDIYSPGETKEKLRIGREVSGDTGNIKIGTFNITATGNISITGVGFKPKLVKFLATKSGGTGPFQSDGSTDGTNQYTIYMYNTNTGMKSYFVSDKVIFIEDGSTGTFYNTTGVITSLDSDGFTIDISNKTLTGTVNVIYTCLG